MAGVTITKGTVGIENVGYSWSGSPPADYMSGLNKIEFRISSTKISGPHDSDLYGYYTSSGSGYLDYERTGSGTITYTITAIMTCQTRTYVYRESYTDWKIAGTGTIDWSTNQYTVGQIIFSSDLEQQIISGVAERVDDYGGKEFKYTYNILTRSIINTSYYTDWSNYKTYEDSFTFYPHPKSFTFIDCFPKNKWQVDKGINSLITNIENFSPYATQWKSWKSQEPAASCPLFFPAGSGSRLTAVRLNAVYNYVFGTQPWSTGDEISAKMFNDLANEING